MQFRRFLCVYANRPFIAWSRSLDADEKKIVSPFVRRGRGGGIGKEQDLQGWGIMRVIVTCLMWNDLIFLFLLITISIIIGLLYHILVYMLV